MDDEDNQIRRIEAFSESFSNRELIEQVRRNRQLLANTLGITQNLIEELHKTTRRMRELMRQAKASG